RRFCAPAARRIAAARRHLAPELAAAGGRDGGLAAATHPESGPQQPGCRRPRAQPGRAALRRIAGPTVLYARARGEQRRADSRLGGPHRLHGAGDRRNRHRQRAGGPGRAQPLAPPGPHHD
nr:hypothetical protein [Tanacetum cinerariifolium]